MKASKFHSTVANGNIETVERFDETGVQYDDLAYHYEKSGTDLLRNRLYHLNETKYGGYDDIGIDISEYHNDHEDVNLLNNYQYDALGNLIQDKREEIANIEWTVSGKVKRITRTADSTKPPLEFAYGADGQRISKTVGDPLNGGYREYYLRDAQGNIMAMYRHTNTGPKSLKVTERPVYGSSRIGSYTQQIELAGVQAITNYPYTQPMSAFLKRYELTDHLGNVNTVVTGRLLDGAGADSPKQAEVVSAQGYEAFGSLLPGRNYSSDSYRFGFNGMEKDDEVHGAGNAYTTSWRGYDPRLGRWLSMDPKTSALPWESPYAFSGNNPIFGNDPEGDVCVPCIQFIIGFALDVVDQMANNLLDGKTVAQSWDKTSLWRAGIAGGLSAASPSALVAKLNSPIIRKVSEEIIEMLVDATQSAVNSYFSDKSINVYDVLMDASFGKVARKASGLIPKFKTGKLDVDIKIQERSVDRQTRVNGLYPRQSRIDALAKEKSQLNNLNARKTFIHEFQSQGQEQVISGGLERSRDALKPSGSDSAGGRDTPSQRRVVESVEF